MVPKASGSSVLSGFGPGLQTPLLEESCAHINTLLIMIHTSTGVLSNFVWLEKPNLVFTEHCAAWSCEVINCTTEDDMCCNVKD